MFSIRIMKSGQFEIRIESDSGISNPYFRLIENLLWHLSYSRRNKDNICKEDPYMLTAGILGASKERAKKEFLQKKCQKYIILHKEFLCAPILIFLRHTHIIICAPCALYNSFFLAYCHLQIWNSF